MSNAAPRFNLASSGYTLIELAIAVAILSVLSAIAIPNFFKWGRLAKIDEAKSILNASAADCLLELRGNQAGIDSHIPRSLDVDRLSSAGYQVKGGKNTCGDVFVAPADQSDDISYQFGFRLVDNRIEKYAFPANDQVSLNSCKAWAGKNCGATPEQLAEWARIAALREAELKCTSAFNEFRSSGPNGGTGVRNTWDNKTNTCSVATWVFQGGIQRDEASFNVARERALGAKCRAEYEPKVGTLDGLFTYSDSACGEPTYFCSGRDLASAQKVDYDACKADERITACKAARAAWIDKPGNGQFMLSQFPKYPNAIGCPDEWKCNGTPGLSAEDYKRSTCAATTPPDCTYDRRGRCIRK